MSKYDPGKTVLEELYKFHSCREVAAMHGVHEETVRKALSRYGIQARGPGSRRTFQPERTELEELYQKHSMKQIARLYNVGETIVWKRLKEYGITLRDYEDGGHRKKPGREFSREHRTNLSKVQRGRWAGENNPHWRGGVHEENMRLRRSGAYKQWRLDALALHGNKCQQCGVENGFMCECCGTGVRLHVHHVKPFAKYPDVRFDPANSEVLCPKCHHSRHHGKPGEFRGTPNVKSRAILSQAA